MPTSTLVVAFPTFTFCVGTQMILKIVSMVLLTIPTDSHWPAFLGSDAGPRSAENLPLEWSPASGVKWIAEIEGHGQSSPVLWGDHVIVTSVSGPMKDNYQLKCFDRTSGEERWTYDLRNSVPVANSYYVSRAAPTPVADAKRIIALFESGDCVAVSHTGDLLWQRDLARDEGPFVAEFGLGASPCQTDTSVCILLEHDGPSCLLALDKKTGQTQWMAGRKPTRSWSSPAVLKVDGKPQIVVSSGGGVQGYSPASGKKLWELENIGGNTGCTPIDCGDGRFLIGASPGRNGEHAGSSAKSNCLVQVTSDGNNFAAEKLWVAEKATPSWASPILHNGLAYWMNRSGVVFCFDAQTGESVYTERLKQSAWATPLAVDDRIYWFGKDGLTTVLKAGREFEVLAENETWQADQLPTDTPPPTEATEERRRSSPVFSKPILYGYAVSSNAFYVRVGNALICCGNAER